MTAADESYGRSFFDAQSGRSLQSARIVLGRLLPQLKPRRVVDVGCGVGTWLRAAQELGVEEVLGTDGDYVDRGALLIDQSRFIPSDLATQTLAEVLGPHAEGRFDLAICMEVAEHLPHERSAGFVSELSALSDVVLFSAAVPFQYGTQHVNEQWPEFWAILFRKQGFACFDPLRTELWSDPRIDWWYAQNALVFVREGSPAAALMPPASRAEGRGLALVHPRNLLSNLLSLPRRFRQDASAEELQDLESLSAANLRGDAVVPPLAAPGRAARADPAARNAFPWTRTEVYQPEEELAEAGRLLHATEHAYRELRAVYDAERAARLAGEAALRERLQLCNAARLAAETRVAELDAAAHEQRQTVQELRRDNAALREVLATAEAARAAAVAAMAAASGPSAGAQPPAERAALGLRAVGRRLPEPVRRAARRPVRLALRALRGPGEPRPAPPADAAPEPPLAVTPTADEQVVPKSPIKRYGELVGEVNWWTLAVGVKRLRHFPLFDAEDYLRRNADVAETGIDPHEHFIQSGALESRGRVDPEELARVMSGFQLFDQAARALPEPQDDAEELRRLAAETGRVGIYVSSHGNVYMDEIAEDLAADLRAAGVEVELLDERADKEARPPICLFVAPHEFFVLGRGSEWVRDDIVSHSFMFGTEQVQTKWFQLALPFVLMSRGVLDICAQTADLFAHTGVGAQHLLPGAQIRRFTLTERDRQHPLCRVLPRAAHDMPDPERGFAERPIDICFFGNSSPRRDAFFARNASFLAELETFNYCRRPGRGPVRGESEDGALTRLAGHVSGHSKITLNIHREEFGYFEWHRMVRLGMCSGSVVVSDPCLPNLHFVAGEHYFQETARHIPDLLEWLLRTPDGQREAERVQRNVLALLTDERAQRRTAVKLLRFFASHRVEVDAAMAEPAT